MKYVDIPVGTKFGKWTTQGPKWKRPGENFYVVAVQCECGSIKVARAYELTGGNPSQCRDCFNSDRPTYLAPKQVVINYVFNDYKKSAARRGYPFTLTKTELAYKIFDDCFYCDSPPRNKTKDRIKVPRELPRYTGLDRMDNSRGYEADNVVPCCNWCNQAKKAKTEEEFFEWIGGLRDRYLTSKLAILGRVD